MKHRNFEKLGLLNSFKLNNQQLRFFSFLTALFVLNACNKNVNTGSVATNNNTTQTNTGSGACSLSPLPAAFNAQANYTFNVSCVNGSNASLDTTCLVNSVPVACAGGVLSLAGLSGQQNIVVQAPTGSGIPSASTNFYVDTVGPVFLNSTQSTITALSENTATLQLNAVDLPNPGGVGTLVTGYKCQLFDSNNVQVTPTQSNGSALSPTQVLAPNDSFACQSGTVIKVLQGVAPYTVKAYPYDILGNLGTVAVFPAGGFTFPLAPPAQMNIALSEARDSSSQTIIPSSENLNLSRFPVDYKFQCYLNCPASATYECSWDGISYTPCNTAGTFTHRVTSGSLSPTLCQSSFFVRAKYVVSSTTYTSNVVSVPVKYDVSIPLVDSVLDNPAVTGSLGQQAVYQTYGSYVDSNGYTQYWDYLHYGAKDQGCNAGLRTECRLVNYYQQDSSVSGRSVSTSPWMSCDEYDHDNNASTAPKSAFDLFVEGNQYQLLVNNRQDNIRFEFRAIDGAGNISESSGIQAALNYCSYYTGAGSCLSSPSVGAGVLDPYNPFGPGAF